MVHIIPTGCDSQARAVRRPWSAARSGRVDRPRAAVRTRSGAGPRTVPAELDAADPLAATRHPGRSLVLTERDGFPNDLYLTELAPALLDDVGARHPARRRGPRRRAEQSWARGGLSGARGELRSPVLP